MEDELAVEKNIKKEADENKNLAQRIIKNEL